ncbi:unnamed protein product, partial [Rotaria magnacalcarata]
LILPGVRLGYPRCEDFGDNILRSCDRFAELSFSDIVGAL